MTPSAKYYKCSCGLEVLQWLIQNIFCSQTSDGQGELNIYLKALSMQYNNYGDINTGFQSSKGVPLRRLHRH